MEVHSTYFSISVYRWVFGPWCHLQCLYALKLTGIRENRPTYRAYTLLVFEQGQETTYDVFLLTLPSPTVEPGVHTRKARRNLSSRIDDGGKRKSLSDPEFRIRIPEVRILAIAVFDHESMCAREFKFSFNLFLMQQNYRYVPLGIDITLHMKWWGFIVFTNIYEEPSSC